MSLETFHKEFLPLKDKLYRFALRIAGNQMDAEDAVQETFARIWKKKKDWNVWTNNEAIAMTIVRNICYDKKRSKHSKVDSLPEYYDQADTAPDPETQAGSTDLYDKIKELMKDLSETQQQIIQLRDIEGYQYKEIAEIMNMSMSQVKVNLHPCSNFVERKTSANTPLWSIIKLINY